jgi:hypothetical protein
MRRRSVRVLAAGLVLFGASLILAQSPEPPHIVRIIREDIKPGKAAAHEKVETGYARAFSKSKYPNYFALENITGSSQAWYVEGYDSYASLEQTIHVAQAEPLKGALDQLDAQDGELRSSERSMIATYQKDLSYLPVPSNLPKARFVTINVVRVRLGHAADFAEMRKLLYAAFDKTNNQLRRVVYNVNSGAPAGTYVILSAMESLKAMDPPPSAMSMAAALGAENQARYNKLQTEIVISSENTLFAVNPKMSNPAKEFITADPDFWAPKPKSAVAKPAGAQ